jgi:hypothetical protein
MPQLTRHTVRSKRLSDSTASVADTVSTLIPPSKRYTRFHCRHYKYSCCISPISLSIVQSAASRWDGLTLKACSASAKVLGPDLTQAQPVFDLPAHSLFCLPRGYRSYLREHLTRTPGRCSCGGRCGCPRLRPSRRAGRRYLWRFGELRRPRVRNGPPRLSAAGKQSPMATVGSQ